MSFQISAYRNRTKDFTGELYLSDKVTPATLEAGDVLRFKIKSTSSGTPILDLSNIATGNGSLIIVTHLGNGTIPATYRLRLAQDDVALLSPGHYYAELLYADDSETAPANATKPIDFGRIVVHDTMSGTIGT